jgi:hypothetical protein
MGSYLVSLQSAFVPSACLTSRLSRPSRKPSAAFAALSKPRQPNRSTSPFGLVGLRLGFPSRNTPNQWNYRNRRPGWTQREVDEGVTSSSLPALCTNDRTLYRHSDVSREGSCASSLLFLRPVC